MVIARRLWLVSFLSLANVSWAQLTASAEPTAAGSQQLPMLRYLVFAKLDERVQQTRLIVMVASLAVNPPVLPPQAFRNPLEIDNPFPHPDENSRDTWIESRGKVHFPAGRRPQILDVSDVRFHQLNGTPLSLDQARKILTRLRPIFFFDRFAGDIVPLPPEYGRRLGDDCIIAVTAKHVRPVD